MASCGRTWIRPRHTQCRKGSAVQRRLAGRRPPVARTLVLRRKKKPRADTDFEATTSQEGRPHEQSFLRVATLAARSKRVPGLTHALRSPRQALRRPPADRACRAWLRARGCNRDPRPARRRRGSVNKRAAHVPRMPPSTQSCPRAPRAQASTAPSSRITSTQSTRARAGFVVATPAGPGGAGREARGVTAGAGRDRGKTLHDARGKLQSHLQERGFALDDCREAE
jgi:hypothetical protein